MRIRLAGAAIALAVLPVVAAASPTGAGGDGGCTSVSCGSFDVAPSGDNFSAEATSQQQIQLNTGGGGSSGPPPCSEEDLFLDGDDNDTPDHTGHFAYVPPINEQDVFRNIEQNSAPGTYWRRVCVFTDGFVPVDDLVSIDFYDAINPQNLARLAVDRALSAVPSPIVHLSPDGDQLVNLETWLWVDGIAETTFSGPSVSVPGITVSVTISTGGVYWDMGDGSAFGCTGAGTPYGSAAGPTCSHTYTRSSASQPDERYHGSASVRWTASYTVNGAGPYQVVDAVVVSTPFSVRVAEGQAIVTG